MGRYDFPAKYLDSDEWWLNSLLVFNVDGRAHNRDKGTSVFPADMRSDYRTVDDAWVAARNMINTAEFQTAIREFPGFQSSTIVKDSRGLPVVGEVLYLRETIHSALSSSSRANGTENSNYELRSEDCNLAGATQTSGKDSRNYAKRIGLNFYWSDINAYKFEDLKDANGNYIWFNRVPNKKYTGEFKQMVVETMRKEGMSCWEADRKFGLPQRRTQTWERIYLEEGPEGLYIERRGRGTKAGHKPALEKKIEEDLIAENQRLRAEASYLKKLASLSFGERATPAEKAQVIQKLRQAYSLARSDMQSEIPVRSFHSVRAIRALRWLLIS